MGTTCCVGNLFYRFYGLRHRRLRWLIRTVIRKLERGEMYSYTLRRIFREYHGIDIGMYTHGGCFVPGALDPFTTVGRYSSIASGVRVMNINHPVQFKSTHGFFFNVSLGRCTKDSMEYTPLRIGSDVWIGHGAYILPNVHEIGHGAVIAAGSVVNKNVPPYSVIAGNPARVVRFRFPREIIDTLLESKWWEKDINEIQPYIEEFQQPFERLFKIRYSGQEDHEKPEEEVVMTGVGRPLHDSVQGEE